MLKIPVYIDAAYKQLLTPLQHLLQNKPGTKNIAILDHKKYFSSQCHASLPSQTPDIIQESKKFLL